MYLDPDKDPLLLKSLSESLIDIKTRDWYVPFHMEKRGVDKVSYTEVTPPLL